MVLFARVVAWVWLFYRYLKRTRSIRRIFSHLSVYALVSIGPRSCCFLRFVGVFYSLRLR